MKEHAEQKHYQEPGEQEELGLVEHISKLKKPYDGELPALKPREKIEQVFLIVGYNAAIYDVMAILRREYARAKTEHRK
jgi:hypothetical protein